MFLFGLCINDACSRFFAMFSSSLRAASWVFLFFQCVCMVCVHMMHFPLRCTLPHHSLACCQHANEFSRRPAAQRALLQTFALTPLTRPASITSTQMEGQNMTIRNALAAVSNVKLVTLKTPLCVEVPAGSVNRSHLPLKPLTSRSPVTHRHAHDDRAMPRPSQPFCAGASAPGLGAAAKTWLCSLAHGSSRH